VSLDVLNILYTAGSALTAQRLRMDVIANNLANVDTTSTPTGGPYRREAVVFQARQTAPLGTDGVQSTVEGGGVQVAAIVQDNRPFNEVYQPGSPQANASGYVAYPNVDLTTEMVDMMEANRAYQANASVIQTSKTLVQTTLDLGRA